MKKKRNGESGKSRKTDSSLSKVSKLSKPRGPLRRKTEKYTPNTKLLFSILESKGITQQEISQKSGVPKGTLSKIFHGKRRPTLKEISVFSAILQTPLEDLLSAFGVALSAPALGGAEVIEVTGWLDANLVLRGVGEESGGVSGLRGSKTAPCPFPDSDIRVARAQTAGSSFDGLDGALVYYRETRSQARGVDASGVGRPGLVRISGETERRLRVLRRGYAAGKYNLTSLAGSLMEEGVAVESIYPVIWLKF